MAPLCVQTPLGVGSGCFSTGPGVAGPKSPCWGCEPVALESEPLPRSPLARSYGLSSYGVVSHGLVDEVGQSAFEAAHCFHRGLGVGLAAEMSPAMVARSVRLAHIGVGLAQTGTT
jgi:hypothetical protein